MTRQKLTAILKRSGLKPSKWYASGQIKNMSHASEGYRLTVVEANERYGQVGTPRRPRRAKVSSDVVGFELEYVARDPLTLSYEQRTAERAANLKRLREALRAAGVPFREKGERLHVSASHSPSTRQ